MIETGTVIAGRYEVLDKIGTGGMSDVYRAMDTSLGREVALKVLKEEFVTDMGFVTKFRAEAMSAAGLEHQNIVNIYDVGNEGDRYYIVMEYVEGVTLKTYISKKGRLSQNELLSIAIQVGRGIEAAHGKNIIHRDIKPQNIIISKEGKVKVTDFGIARAVTGNTINADRMGSVHYSSPEQARNGFVTYQSDIYSLGIVMYEMCTGTVPFDGDTTVAIAIQHLQSEITPPHVLVPDVPISVEKIILKATMKNPERRYENITEMLNDLKRALISHDEDFVVIAPAATSVEEVAVVKEPVEEIEKSIQKAIPTPSSRRKRAEEDYDYEEDEDDDEPGVVRKMDRVVTILGIIAAVVIIGIVVYLLGSFLGFFHFGPGNNGETTTTSSISKEAEPEVSSADMKDVPNVVGRQETEAREIIENAGFVYHKIGDASSEEYEAGLVINQSIEGGEQAEIGATIDIMVSSGAGDTDVPPVSGMTQDDAVKSLESMGFVCIVQPEFSTDVEQGRVIRQEPAPNVKAKEGDSVTIYVSRGKEVIRVPSVAGKSEEEAVAELEAAGFVVEIEEEHSDSVEVGIVISQTPRGQAEKDSTVTITVSLGPQEPEKLYKVTLSLSPVDGEPVYVVVKGPGDEIIAQQVVTEDINMNLSGIPFSSGTVYYYSNYDRSVELLPSQTIVFNEQ